MYSWTRTRVAVAVGLALAVAWLPAEVARGQGDKKKGDSKEVSFKSYDGVELTGTFYPAKGKDKDAVVLLLHDFSPRKGGDSHQDNLDDFAAKLQAAGYAVLSFDFRGFGQSKSVDKEFWSRKYPHNLGATRKRVLKTPPESIDHKDFQPTYYRYLVNDIAAAKSYLDRKNDSREVNTSNLIVIGAGQGATLGALWMCSQWYVRRDKSALPVGPPMLGDPEGRDQVCAVWLSISPTLGTHRAGDAVHKWLSTVGRTNKVPMAFVYGKGDSTTSNFAQSLLKQIRGAKAPAAIEKLTGREEADGTLVGTALLNPRLKKDDWIVNTYLRRVFEERRLRDRVNRETEKHRYFFTMASRTTLAKPAGEDTQRVNVNAFFSR